MAPLANKIALITGATKRIGRAIAIALAEEGIDTILHYKDSEKEVQTVALEIESLGRSAWTLRADLSDRNQVNSLIERAVHQAGPMSILINNASIFPKNRLMDFTGTDIDINIQVNAFAPLILSRNFSVHAQNGVIINFLDSRITDYDVEHAAYHISKRMLFTVTRMLALELAPRFRVNAVAPGLILPPEGEGAEYLEKMKIHNPLNSYGNPRDITETVKFLISSQFITGQVVFVDGGRHLKGSVYG